MTITSNKRLFTTESETAAELIDRFDQTRKFTETLCETLIPEDYVVQSMPDVSPTKWHLGHTTWFFEAFILRDKLPGYVSPDARYNYLFNSYYNAIGDPWSRTSRGLLSRPSVDEVYDFRKFANEKMHDLFDRMDRDADPERLRELTILGVNHEQQHQELLLTDIKNVFSLNPMNPVLRDFGPDPEPLGVPPMEFLGFDGGLVEVGYDGSGFHFDNEGPYHPALLRPFELASRLVTNGEYMEFIEAGEYERPTNWLDKGWKTILSDGWNAPLYWEKSDQGWTHYTLGGRRLVNPDEPLVHVSYFEADAYARWKGLRLPTEFEWEVAAKRSDTPNATLVESLRCHPTALGRDAERGKLHQMFGEVWEWTSSPYSAYPGFKSWEGAVGEYNGKWMVDQMVLRGGSCATSESHIRASYRNFFPADARWQFMGVRLAKDAA